MFYLWSHGDHPEQNPHTSLGAEETESSQGW